MNLRVNMTSSWRKSSTTGRGCRTNLRIILTDGLSRPFCSEWREGVHVERAYSDESKARQDLQTAPMNVYTYLDGRILHDPGGCLVRLSREAQERFEGYRCPERERARLAYWLASAQEKLNGALVAGDMLKAAYVASTTTWPIMEGLWAASDRPTPPNSSVRPHLGDLRAGPPDVSTRYETLFLGDAQERVQTAIEIISWIVGRLEDG